MLSNKLTFILFSMRIFFLLTIALSVCGCQATTQHRRSIQPSVSAQQKKIFIVIDDAGPCVGEVQRLLHIPVSMTIAVLPHQKHTTEVCGMIESCPNKEIILHQPMEAYDAEKNPGAGAIRSQTKPSDIPEILKNNLASVRGAVGMNNHMGSRITENRELMRAVLQYCKASDLFYLDSKTAYNSQVPRLAYEEQMHHEERHVFLDVHSDRSSVRHMWGSAIAQARKRGYVVVIGHTWSKETALAIRDSYQTLLNQGYTFHRLSELY